MLKDPEVWNDPLESLAQTDIINRFIGYITIGFMGGITAMMVTLGTFNFQFYTWGLTTNAKTIVGSVAVLVGAAIAIGVVWQMVRKGPIRKRLHQLKLSEDEEGLAFAVHYYRQWVGIRSWCIRAGLLLAAGVALSDRYLGTELQMGLEVTGIIYFALFPLLGWAEWQFFRRLGSIPNVVTRQVSTSLIIGSLATGLSFLLIMPQLSGGLSLIDLREIGFSSLAINAVSVLVFVASEWSNRTVQGLAKRARLAEISK